MNLLSISDGESQLCARVNDGMQQDLENFKEIIQWHISNSSQTGNLMSLIIHELI
jgi:hypothetical protein